MAKKQGISLVVLVMTIIIMTIITGVTILSIGNIDMAGEVNLIVEKTNIKEVETLAMNAWKKAYEEGKTLLEELQEAVDIALVENNLYEKYMATVTTSGIVVEPVKEIEVPDKWKANVSKITRDGVPIPVGFVESPYPNENRKNAGLVIYALTEEEIETSKKDITKIDPSYEHSLENRNQFVWVPVNDFEKDFVREDFGEIDSRISNALGTKYWEIVLEENNLPANSEKNTLQFISADKLSEATAMYASVKEYGGFYIGRYEAGMSEVIKDDSMGYIAKRVTTSDGSNEQLLVAMRKYPYNHVGWGESISNETSDNRAVVLARNFYPKDENIYGAVSTLTYSVQWDTTAKWIRKVNSTINLKQTTEYGVHQDTAFTLEDVNKNAWYSEYVDGVMDEWRKLESKINGDKYILTTGAYKKSKLNNIYDMSGNLSEWTMEGFLSGYSVIRGGDFESYGTASPFFYRDLSFAYFETEYYGFRPALYIKNI